jgi:hypothetical protein
VLEEHMRRFRLLVGAETSVNDFRVRRRRHHRPPSSSPTTTVTTKTPKTTSPSADLDGAQVAPAPE